MAGLDRQLGEVLASYSEGFYLLSQEREAQIPSLTGLRVDWNIWACPARGVGRSHCACLVQRKCCRHPNPLLPHLWSAGRNPASSVVVEGAHIPSFDYPSKDSKAKCLFLWDWSQATLQFRKGFVNNECK